MVVEPLRSCERHTARLGLAVAWLTLGAFGMSCGGQSSDVHERDPSDGASGSASGGSPSAVSHAGTGGSQGAGDGVSVPAGAISIALSPSNVAGRACNAGKTGAFTYAIGDPTASRVVADGYAGVSAHCTLQVLSSGLGIDATVQGTDANGGEPFSVSISAEIADDGSTPATLTFFSPDTGHLSTLVDFPGCTLLNVDRSVSDAIVADVSCPFIGAADDSVSGCKAYGTFAFVNCKTE